MHTKHTLALADDGNVYAFGEGPGLGISPVNEGKIADVTRRRGPERISGLVCMTTWR
jgi:alpha-tubulin suppressor-like RCC1 family protein